MTAAANEPAGTPGKGPSPAATSVEPAAPSKAQWDKLVEVTSRSDLFGSHTGDPIPDTQNVFGPGLVFQGPVGGVSKRSSAARPGQIYRATTTLKVEGSGASPPVHVGPMFLGVRDEVLFYSVAVPVLSSGKEQSIDVEAVAPPGTVSVRLRLVGGWAENEDSTAFTYKFGKAALFRKSA